MEVITITIDEKKPYTGGAEKHPEGDFYCDSIKYTCWDKILFETFKVGDYVKIDYTEKKNEYNGRTFINRNISKMKYSSPCEVKIEDLQDAEYNGSTNSELLAGNVVIEGKKYEVLLRLV